MTHITRMQSVQIRNRVQEGVKISEVAQKFNITEERVKGFLPAEEKKPAKKVKKKAIDDII